METNRHCYYALTEGISRISLVFCTIPSVIIHTIGHGSSAFWLEIFDKLKHRHFVSSMMISLDTIDRSQKSQADILSLMNQFDDKWSMIMAEKWVLRAQIKRANVFIRVTMAAYEVQFFVWFVFMPAYLVTETRTQFDAVTPVLYILCSHLHLFKVVMEGSDFLESCREGEGKLLELHQNKQVDRRCLKTVRVSEDWEALQVGFSPMGGPNLVSFLVSSFACTAVILQFAYRVIRVMNHLSLTQ